MIYPNRLPIRVLLLLLAATPWVSFAQSDDLMVVDAYRWDEVAPEDPNAAGRFGTAVETDGQWAMVAAPSADGRLGRITLFRAADNGRPWQVVKALTIPDGLSSCRAGTRMSLVGDWLIAVSIGSCLPLVYQRDEGGIDNWGLQSQLPAPLDVADLRRGFAASDVSISGDLVAVGRSETDFIGSPSINAMGEVAIYQRSAGSANTWVEIALITPPEGDREGGRFGTRVALEGGELLVGAASFSDDTFTGVGRAWLFERNLGGVDNWGLRRRFLNPRPSASAGFGDDVEIENSVAAIAGPAGDLTPAVSGDRAVYMYQQDADGSNAWGLTDEVLPQPTDGGFGGNIQMDGNLMLVGDGPGVFGGAGGWLYQRNGSVWPLRQAFLAADTNEPQPELFRNLGLSIGLAIQGTRMVAIVADNVFELTNAGSRIGKAFFFEYDDGLFSDSFED